MHLTLAQQQALKTNILANSDTQTAWNAGNDSELQRLFNELAVPTFTVWKPNVQLVDVANNFNAAELGGLTTANSSRLQVIAAFYQQGVDPSRADVRTFFADIFSTGGLTAAALLLLWKRSATRFEKLFATGTGTVAVPATLGIGLSGVIEGPVQNTEFAPLRLI